MPIPALNLDDRAFDQLAAEARSLIPKYFPPWTDHNPSDPGITLLELFAFLTDAAIYQINRIPERSMEAFVKLVGQARQVDPTGKPEAIEDTLYRAVVGIRERYRAVTAGDFEAVVKEIAPDPARVHVSVSADGVVQVTVAPALSADQPQSVFARLRERGPITTRVWVVEPEFTEVHIDATVIRDIGSRLDSGAVKRNAEQGVRRFLDPLTGGTEGKGWEFGRSVFRSELYQILEGIRGVDHVQRLLLDGDDTVGEFPLSSRRSLVDLPKDEPIVNVVDAGDARGA